MANISESKRSAFDILMSKKKEHTQKKQDELNNSFKQQNESFSDIILIENKLIGNCDVIEIIDDEKPLKNSSGSASANKKANPSNTSSSPNENQTKRTPISYEKKTTAATAAILEAERGLYAHVQQYSGIYG